MNCAQALLCFCFISLSGFEFYSAAAAPTNKPLRRSPTYLLLYNILTSHGTLKPSFRQKTFNYDLKLSEPLSSVSIVPELNMSLPDYENGKNLPVISIKTEPDSNLGLRQNQIVIQSSNSVTKVTIDVVDPSKLSSKKTYSIKIHPYKKTALVTLTSIDAVQNNGVSAVISNSFNEKVIYAYVNPDTAFVILKPACAKGNTAKVNGNTVNYGEQFKIMRDISRYRQMVVVSCGQSSIVKNYVVLIISTLTDKDIPEPHVVVSQRGQECVKKPNTNDIMCEVPKLKDSKLQLFPVSINSTVHYAAKSSNELVNVRLLDKANTLSFPAPSTSMQIVAKAGLGQKTWNLHFVTVSSPIILKFQSLALGLLILVLLLSVVVICGLASLSGIGSPIGMSGIALTLVFLIQCIVYTEQYHGVDLFNKVTEYTKWVTCAWLLPWEDGFYTFHLDVTDLKHAYGCLYWCGVVIGLVIICHTLVTFLFYYAEGHTFPHKMRLGVWEQRVLHGLALPIAYSSTIICTHAESTMYWKYGSMVCLLFLLIWGIGSGLNIKFKKDSQSITWVWQYPMNEQQEYKDNETGYWSDVVCDQLSTQPVNRSLCTDFIPWRWTAIVADIEPVNICVGLMKRGTTESTESCPMFADPYGDGAIPFGTVAKRVDILQTVPPTVICTGQRLVCGLLRCNWVDILYTYQALTNYYSTRYIDMKRSYATIPLTVKTCQLTGPITNGINLFFFDGVRVPYIRVYEILFRVVIGVCLGIANNHEDFLVRTIAFSVCAISAAMLSLNYLSYAPYVKMSENSISLLVTFSICALSVLCLGTILDLAVLGMITKATLYIIFISLMCLSVYAMSIVFSIYSAIMCPPLEEIKLLENCANCTIIVSDHLDEWSVEMPAYVKKKVKDLKAQCTFGEDSTVRLSVFPSGNEPSLEFSTDEMLVACSTETLPVPLLVIFLPESSLTLGYRWLNIYDARNAHAQIRTFIELTPKYKVIAESVAKTLAHQIETGGNFGKTILTVTIILPKSLKA